MVQEPAVNFIQCPSCLRRNDAVMQFCIYCGAGLTAEADKKRTENPLTWRACPNCGQANELNQNHCIFCSGKIVLPAKAGDSPAMRKFSRELEQVDAKKLMAKKQVESQRLPARRSKFKMGLALPLAVLGVVAGAGLAVIIGPSGLERLILQFTWPKEGLVVYTDTPYAEVLIEDPQKKAFKATQLGSDGTICITDLPACGEDEKYTITISSPGRLTVRQRFPIVEKRITLVGWPTRIPL